MAYLEEVTLNSVNKLKVAIKDIKEGRISKMDLYDIAEETQTYLRYSGKTDECGELLNEAYSLTK